MPLETFLWMVVFALVTSVTPGPNNLMLLASGVNFGFARTIPHMFGIALGFGSLLLSVGLGLGALLIAWPALGVALKAAGAAYLLYLAWKIAGSRTMGSAGKASKPITLLQAAAFQWVNPKAWMMSITAMALYADPLNPGVTVPLVALSFVIVNFPSVSLWAGFGTMLRSFLDDPQRLKWFNIVMAVLLVATLVPMLR
ncbi:LysE family translocator [Hoeflea sp. WL0058]|uniref:LysE family translocator n=1 Tax=Flavimaribacter sediminis TaxID=2865987 RepID=A0AAE2ZJ00_9HYPH|nr:LysE family translocator [Flavimaribacter sediminis]MBW8635836.1 LysE family translocator [Flavimaribacter sediminis]